jgi:hypothetical protein
LKGKIYFTKELKKREKNNLYITAQQALPLKEEDIVGNGLTRQKKIFYNRITLHMSQKLRVTFHAPNMFEFLIVF